MEKLPHHCPITFSPGSQNEIEAAAGNLCAISIANTAATAQSAHGVGINPFKISKAEPLSSSGNKLADERNRAAAQQRLTVKDDTIRECQGRHQQPGDAECSQGPDVVRGPQE